MKNSGSKNELELKNMKADICNRILYYSASEREEILMCAMT